MNDVNKVCCVRTLFKIIIKTKKVTGLVLNLTHTKVLEVLFPALDRVTARINYGQTGIRSKVPWRTKRISTYPYKGFIRFSSHKTDSVVKFRIETPEGIGNRHRRSFPGKIAFVPKKNRYRFPRKEKQSKFIKLLIRFRKYPGYVDNFRKIPLSGFCDFNPRPSNNTICDERTVMAHCVVQVRSFRKFFFVPVKSEGKESEREPGSLSIGKIAFLTSVQSVEKLKRCWCSIRYVEFIMDSKL